MKQFRVTFFLSLILISISCSSQTTNSYPAHWWQEVDASTAPSWEILPQDAKQGEVILSKRNELGLLSNFADTPFTFKGKKYASMEGFWQAMKFPEGPNDERIKPGIVWTHKRTAVEQMIGFNAKRAGKEGSNNMKALNIDWVSFENKKMTYRSLTKAEHYKLIVNAMREKLKQNSKVKAVLLQTGNLILRPDHTQKMPTPPAWKYHEIWMEIRTKLQNSME